MRRDFVEKSDIMANVTKLTPMQKERNDRLLIAAKNGDINSVKVLIERGADVDARNWLGRTALHEAVLYKHIEIAKMLIENGADVDAKDKWERTALHAAAKEGTIEIAKILIEKGADVDAKDIDGWTAQEIAMKNGHYQIVELIKNAKKIVVENKDSEKEVRIAKRSDIDILNMDMDELVRRADESAKRLCRKE